MAQLVKNRLQCGRPGFNSWVGKILWRRERLTTPVFWPGEFQGVYRSWGCKELDRTEPLSLSLSDLAEDSVCHFPFSHSGKWRKRVRIIHGVGLLM